MMLNAKLTLAQKSHSIPPQFAQHRRAKNKRSRHSKNKTNTLPSYRSSRRSWVCQKAWTDEETKDR